jgi:hypothetical protein
MGKFIHICIWGCALLMQGRMTPPPFPPLMRRWGEGWHAPPEFGVWCDWGWGALGGPEGRKGNEAAR